MRLSTHPHIEFLVLEAGLEHPEKTLEKNSPRRVAAAG